MEINNNEKTIDLRQFLVIAKEKKVILLGIIAICTIMAVIISYLLPKSYSSTTLVRIKTNTSTVPVVLTNIANQMGIDTGESSANSPESYIEVMKSREVIEPIIQNLNLPDEVKEKMTADGFVKSNLEFSNAKKTNLISITAYGQTPEEAQMISQSVVDNFTKLADKLNQTDNKDALKLLEEKMIVAQKEMNEAEDKLSSYQQEKKIYAPDEQTKAIIDNLTVYDKAIAELQAQADGDNAKLSGVTTQLQEQNASLLQYNVSDNANIGNLREAIVNKRVELVGLQQRYTEEHPDVIRARKELMSLEMSLSDEINRAVNSQSVTLSPVQSGLLQSKLETETKVAVNNASLEALKAKESEAENAISTLSADTVEYARLLRDSKIKSDIYTTLVKAYEQTKINEANKAMNIQVVDSANLPSDSMPAKPNKKIIVAIGFVLGVIISIGYISITYLRK